MTKDTNLRLVAWAAMGMFGVNALYAAIESGAWFMHESLTQAQLETLVSIENLWWPMTLVTVALFLTWSYVAHANLTRLGLTRLTFRNGSTIWWWVVPVAWIWMPFRVMFETARASLADFTDTFWDQKGVPRIAVWWTISFYAAWLSTRVASSFVTSAAQGIAWLMFGGAAIITAALIQQITSAQINRVEVLAASGAEGAPRSGGDARSPLATPSG